MAGSFPTCQVPTSLLTPAVIGASTPFITQVDDLPGEIRASRPKTAPPIRRRMLQCLVDCVNVFRGLILKPKHSRPRRGADGGRITSAAILGDWMFKR